MLPIRQFLRDRSATTAIEYSIIAGLISIVIVAAVTMVGANLQATFYSKIAAAFP